MGENSLTCDVVGAARLCPKRPQVVVCDQDPALRFPASCDAYRCDACGPRKALHAAAIASWAVRQTDRARLFTGTLAPEDWHQRRQKMRDFRRYMVRRGHAWEWAWTTEVGSRTGMVHVHGLQHGDYVGQRVLEGVWGARVDIRALGATHDRQGAALYVTKDALRVAGYAVKGALASPQGLREHLDLNGGRAMHWSRGFLHGLDKRAAAAAMREDLVADDVARTWHLEQPTPEEHTTGVPRP